MSTPETKPPKPLGKTLRTMKAVLRTGYDAQTKHLLNVYAFHLNSERPDWDVWSGQESLSRESGLSVDTIARIQDFLVKEGVFIKRPPHPLTKRKKKRSEKEKGGRPPRCFAIDIEHLESLGYHDEKITQRDSRAKTRLLARQAQALQAKINRLHEVALRDDLARTIHLIRREMHAIPGGVYGEQQALYARLHGKARRLLRTWHRRQRGEPLSRLEAIEQERQCTPNLGEIPAA